MITHQNILGLLLVLTAALILSPAYGFNITRLLDQHSDFSNFNNLLSQTGVASDVNSRRTITILALDNSATGGISGRSSDVIKAIMATHVVLDYYDTVKLGSLSKNKSALLTTLYQSSGRANGKQGFINVTVEQGQVMFGSAVNGAPHYSQLVKVVATQPFNISVLQVSSPIIPPGIDQITPSPPPTAPPPRKVGPPLPSPPPTDSPSDSPDADSPADDDDTSSSPSPSEAPKADSDTPGSSPAPGPATDDAADKDQKKKSDGSRVATSSGLFLVAAALACLVAL